MLLASLYVLEKSRLPLAARGDPIQVQLQSKQTTNRCRYRPSRPEGTGTAQVGLLQLQVKPLADHIQVQVQVTNCYSYHSCRYLGQSPL